jgi:hypothetical protein
VDVDVTNTAGGKWTEEPKGGHTVDVLKGLRYSGGYYKFLTKIKGSILKYLEITLKRIYLL